MHIILGPWIISAILQRQDQDKDQVFSVDIHQVLTEICLQQQIPQTLSPEDIDIRCSRVNGTCVYVAS